MNVLGIDLGGTKLSSAQFNIDGHIRHRDYRLLEQRKGAEVGALIKEVLKAQLSLASASNQPIHAIGVSVPGISNRQKNTIWAPNIPGWENYPLLDELQQISGPIPVVIESDRSCYILGETWQGAAKNCTDAIYMAVGTGIGIGILSDGHLIRGSGDIAGAIGWLALAPSYQEKYKSCGQFEYFCSGEGIARLAHEQLSTMPDYSGLLKNRDKLSAFEVFEAYSQKDDLAVQVFRQCVEYWGMVVANLVSLFNPQKIILGGGVFGPALQFIPGIYAEAKKWAQPVSITQYELLSSALGTDAGLYGAGYAALINLEKPNSH